MVNLARAEESSPVRKRKTLEKAITSYSSSSLPGGHKSGGRHEFVTLLSTNTTCLLLLV